jgi:hypothetical protein
MPASLNRRFRRLAPSNLVIGRYPSSRLLPSVVGNNDVSGLSRSFETLRYSSRISSSLWWTGISFSVKRRIILRDFCFIILRTQPVSSNEESRKPLGRESSSACLPSLTRKIIRQMMRKRNCKISHNPTQNAEATNVWACRHRIAPRSLTTRARV